MGRDMDTSFEVYARRAAQARAAAMEANSDEVRDRSERIARLNASRAKLLMEQPSPHGVLHALRYLDID